MANGVASSLRSQASVASVTGVGGPVLLVTSVSELERGDVLAGRYQIEALIGTGGSGRVLRAFDRVTRTPVALKILRPEFVSDPVWTERFSRELRVGRRIQHPNVCRVFDIGDADGHRFLSMELATGGTIRAQIATGAAPRSLQERIADARAVIEGVAALHEAGVVHRDLKPENILRMDDGRLVVSDFGLATDPGAGPATTIMIGTPRYMAAEVVMGEPANARSDVWALGVVMHEILFGCRPDRSVVRRGHRRFTPPPVTSLKERRLAELCGRCSDDDPVARPSSAVEVSREFEVALLGRRFGRNVVKKQIAWAAVALVTLGTLGLIRDRWTSSAIASSSKLAAGSLAERVLQPAGTPADWSIGSTKLAAFQGRVHCFSLNAARDTARVIWGEPRRAEEIDVRTGKRTPWSALSPETFESGCPQLTADGKSLLFEKTVDGAQHIFLADPAKTPAAKDLVRGAGPLWLPNGEEFAFTVDSRHAGIFSIPTREMTLVSDSVSTHASFEDKAVDRSGTHLAILYTTESFGSFLVVHALPGLEVIGQSAVPQWARNLGFSPSGDVLFTVPGSTELREALSVDPAMKSLRSLAIVPGSSFQEFLTTSNQRLIVTRNRQLNLWRERNGNLLPVTSDGHSTNGAISITGKLLIQRGLSDRGDVIVLRDQSGHESQVTDGPSDVTPSFLPDGNGWLYSKLTTGEIVECLGTSNRCLSIHKDSLIPSWPVADPSGRKIAYVTSLNASRIRVISRLDHNGAWKDLGPAVECGPIWTSPHRIWAVVSAPPTGRVWAEIDVETGARTGVIQSVPVVAGNNPCPFPASLRGDTSPVFPVALERSQVVREPLTLGR